MAVPIVAGLYCQEKTVVSCNKQSHAGIADVGMRDTVGAAGRGGFYFLCGKAVLEPVIKIVFPGKLKGVRHLSHVIGGGKGGHIFIVRSPGKEKFPDACPPGDGGTVRKVYIILILHMHVKDVGGDVLDFGVLVQMYKSAVRHIV